jgi:cell division protein ZipA
MRSLVNNTYFPLTLFVVAAIIITLFIWLKLRTHKKNHYRDAYQTRARDDKEFTLIDDFIEDVGPVRISTSHEKPLSNSAATCSNNTWPNVICLYIKAAPQQFFYGYDLMQSIANHGLTHGNLDFFHFSENQSTLFSLASIDPPGTFDLTKTGTLKISGLCLFLQPNRFKQPLIHFDKMVEIANQMAEELDGSVEDEDHHLLTEERLNYWREILADKGQNR